MLDAGERGDGGDVRQGAQLVLGHVEPRDGVETRHAVQLPDPGVRIHQF